MLKQFTFFLFITISCSSIFAQTQLSNFDNQVPAIEYTSNGIVNIEGIEYLIETNLTSLRVSSISDDVEIIYEVSDFPDFKNLRTLSSQANLRSKYHVKDEFLYEIFSDQIRKRNILTSEIVDVYSFPNDEIRFLSSVGITDNFIHFETENGNESSLYNIATQEFKILPFNLKNTYRDGDIYFTTDLVHGIVQYNAVTDSTIMMFENETHLSSSFTSKNSTINGQKGLVYGGEEGTRFINADTTFLLICDFYNSDFSEVIIYDTPNNYLVFNYDEIQNETIIQVINKADCSVSSSATHPNTGEQFVKLFDHPVFEKEYLLIAMNYNGFIPSIVLLMDLSNFSNVPVSFQDIQIIYENSFYRSGDEVYFMGHNVFDVMTDDQLFSVNLVTKEFKNSHEGISYMEALAMGSSENESTILLTRNQNLSLDVSKFNNGSDTEIIQNIVDTQNAGLNSVRHLAIDNEKLVFKFEDGIYLADNFSTSSDKVSLITHAQEISNLNIKNNTLEGLVNYDDTTYHLKYQFDTNVLTTDAKDTYVTQDSKSIIFDNYIFGQFTISNKLYFDLTSGSFNALPIDGDLISMHRSNNHMLFLSSCSAGFCLTSFIDGDIIDTQHSFQNEPDIHSKENGEFIITDNIAQFEKVVRIIRKDGSAGDHKTILGSRSNANQENIEKGQFSCMMFHNSGTNDLEVVMHRYDKIHSYKIPYLFGGFAPITWYKAGNNLILRSEDSDHPGIYVFSLGKEPKKLMIHDEGDLFFELLCASHKDGILTFLLKSHQGDFEIIEYNIETEELNITSTNNTFLRYTWYAINPMYQISDSKFFVTLEYQYLYETYENGEIYVFDTEELTFTQEIDLNQRTDRSNPHNFIASPTHLFFIGRSHPDNSYQLYVQEKEDITSTQNPLPQLSFVNVHPNPTTDFISMDTDADEVYISDVMGRMVLHSGQYSHGQKIDVSILERGIYFIEIVKDNIKTASSFIKN